jgi:general secretion pathway protein D
VGTRVKITPHINDKNQVRLEIEDEISNPGSPTGALGAVPIQRRTATTTVVVDDQQTVVIGGLIRDSVNKGRTKIPILGDLPVLGFLFRSTTTTKQKSNLLLILTPYVIQDQTDLRKIFERKMQERQEFLDRYFVFNSTWEAPKDFARSNGLVEDIRQAFMEIEERTRLEEELRPREQLEHVPQRPLELPGSVRGEGGGKSDNDAKTPAKPKKPKATPAKPQRPQQRPARQRKTGSAAPLVIQPLARSVNVERTE